MPFPGWLNCVLLYITKSERTLYGEDSFYFHFFSCGLHEVAIFQASILMVSIKSTMIKLTPAFCLLTYSVKVFGDLANALTFKMIANCGPFFHLCTSYIFFFLTIHCFLAKKYGLVLIFIWDAQLCFKLKDRSCDSFMSSLWIFWDLDAWYKTFITDLLAYTSCKKSYLS